MLSADDYSIKMVVSQVAPGDETPRGRKDVAWEGEGLASNKPGIGAYRVQSSIRGREAKGDS